jgi:hypothetical protein
MIVSCLLRAMRSISRSERTEVPNLLGAPGGHANSKTHETRKVRLVTQPNRNSGCGPACVAMVSRVSFEDAVLAMWGKPRRRGFQCTYDDIKRALSVLSVSPAPRALRCTSFSRLTELSIVGCQRRRNGGWHCVVFDPERQRLLDPLKSKRVRKPVAELDRLYRPFSRLAVRF